MNMIRTTIRVRDDFKKAAEKLAVDEGKSFQSVYNEALGMYLLNKSKKRAKKIVFKTHDLGVDVDSLNRDDFYDDSSSV